jgi:hypothetical protein
MIAYVKIGSLSIKCLFLTGSSNLTTGEDKIIALGVSKPSFLIS